MPPSKSADPPPHSGAKRPSPPLLKPEVREGFVAVGVALTSFGLRGDVKVEPLTDFPERYEPGQRVWFAGRERRIQSSRWQGSHVYVKLTGINSPEAVAELRGQFLEVAESARSALDDDQYYRSDILGLDVETTTGERIGTVADFMATGANDVLVVRGPLGEVLIPMVADVIREVDVAGRRLTIEPLEGLLPNRTALPSSEKAPVMRGKGGKHRRSAPKEAGQT